MRSKSLFAAALMVAGILASSSAGAATVVFDFSYSGNLQGNAISGSGTISATDNGDGSFTAISGSGTSTEAGALTLLAAGSYTNNLAPTVVLTSDNLLFPSATPTLDSDGLVFQGSSPPLASNSVYINIFGNGAGYAYFNNYDAFPNSNDYYAAGTNDFQLAVSETPLPATLPLFASGLGVIGLLARRRKRKAALAA